MIGETLSHYRIIEKIGQGGMGEVFLADDTSLHRKVALRFLPPALQQDSAARKRFLREAHSAAALDMLERAHAEREPNIPYISCLPIFDPLRAEPRFQGLLRKMNLPQ